MSTVETQTTLPPCPIILTSAAVVKILDILAEENDPALKLRISVEGGGCSGFQYRFGLESAQDIDNDYLYSVDSVPLLIDLFSYQYLDGATLDYEEKFMESRFVVRNPNASSQCGCGSSFSVG